MPIKKEYSAEGVKLTHQSGVVTFLTIEQMRRIKKSQQDVISIAQARIDQLDADMASIEAAKKAA